MPFQSTRPRGARLNGVPELVEWPKFQSTRPRGARRPVISILQPLGCFNPRAHVGRDTRDSFPPTHSPGFNPRAHVGRDGRRYGTALVQRVSIHAPTWGATAVSLSPTILTPC